MGKLVSITKRFVWGSGSRTSANAYDVGSELSRLQRATKTLTAIQVVESAADPSSPLHAEFEWDDTVAAQAYRVEQAKYLIRHIRVMVNDQEPRHLFVSVTLPKGERPVYVPLPRVLSDADLFAQVVQQAASDMEAFERRYQDFTSLADIGADAKRRLWALMRKQA